MRWVLALVASWCVCVLIDVARRGGVGLVFDRLGRTSYVV